MPVRPPRSKRRESGHSPWPQAVAVRSFHARSRNGGCGPASPVRGRPRVGPEYGAGDHHPVTWITDRLPESVARLINRSARLTKHAARPSTTQPVEASSWASRSSSPRPARACNSHAVIPTAASLRHTNLSSRPQPSCRCAAPPGMKMGECGGYPESVWGRLERAKLTGAVSPNRSRTRDALRHHRLLRPARGSTQDSVCMCWASPPTLDAPWPESRRRGRDGSRARAVCRAGCAQEDRGGVCADAGPGGSRWATHAGATAVRDDDPSAEGAGGVAGRARRQAGGDGEHWGVLAARLEPAGRSRAVRVGAGERSPHQGGARAEDRHQGRAVAGRVAAAWPGARELRAGPCPA